MTSEREVLEVFERANPVPDPDVVTVEPDADRFLARLLDVAWIVVDTESAGGQPVTHRRRWLLPTGAAAVVVSVVAGLVVFSRGDADAPAPADTTPATTTPLATTTPEEVDEAGDTSDIIDRFFEAYSAGDTETVRALLADDVIITERYDGTQPDPSASPIPSPIQHVVTSIERGETVTEVNCDQVDPQATFCSYSMQIHVGGSPVWIPMRALLSVTEGHIDELHQGFGSEEYDRNFAMDDLIFRSHPELWDAVFGDVSTIEQAAEQGRQRAAWLEIAMVECTYASHCKSPRVPAPTIPAEQILEFAAKLRGDRWVDATGGYSGNWPGCTFSPRNIDLDPSQDPPDIDLFGLGLEPVQPGLPFLIVDAPAIMSAEQSEIIVDWILDAASCDPSTSVPQLAEPVRVTTLPPDVPARGFIANDEYAVFAVTHPRGGIVWMTMSDGNVTLELINELATIAQQYLDDALGASTAAD